MINMVWKDVISVELLCHCISLRSDIDFWRLSSLPGLDALLELFWRLKLAFPRLTTLVDKLFYSRIRRIVIK